MVLLLQDGERGDSASMSLSTPLMMYLWCIFLLQLSFIYLLSLVYDLVLVDIDFTAFQKL